MQPILYTARIVFRSLPDRQARGFLAVAAMYAARLTDGECISRYSSHDGTWSVTFRFEFTADSQAEADRNVLGVIWDFGCHDDNPSFSRNWAVDSAKAFPENGL